MERSTVFRMSTIELRSRKSVLCSSPGKRASGLFCGNLEVEPQILIGKTVTTSAPLICAL